MVTLTFVFKTALYKFSAVPVLQEWLLLQKGVNDGDLIKYSLLNEPSKLRADSVRVTSHSFVDLFGGNEVHSGD